MYIYIYINVRFGHKIFKCLLYTGIIINEQSVT